MNQPNSPKKRPSSELALEQSHSQYHNRIEVERVFDRKWYRDSFQVFYDSTEFPMMSSLIWDCCLERFLSARKDGFLFLEFNGNKPLKELVSLSGTLGLIIFFSPLRSKSDSSRIPVPVLGLPHHLKNLFVNTTYLILSPSLSTNFNSDSQPSMRRRIQIKLNELESLKNIHTPVDFFQIQPYFNSFRICLNRYQNQNHERNLFDSLEMQREIQGELTFQLRYDPQTIKISGFLLKDILSHLFSGSFPFPSSSSLYQFEILSRLEYQSFPIHRIILGTVDSTHGMRFGNDFGPLN